VMGDFMGLGAGSNWRLAVGALVLAAGSVGAQPVWAQDGLPVVRRDSAALDAIIAKDAKIELIAEGVQWAEGPAWVASGVSDGTKQGGYLVFSDPPANLLRRWDAKNGVSVVLNPSGTADFDPKLVREAGSNGVIPDKAGGIIIANSGGRTIEAIDLKSGKRHVLADRYNGKRFSSPNDLVRSPDGRIYFTDPPYGFSAGDASPLKEAAQNGVYLLKAGKVSLVDGSLTRPNGVGLSPDGRRLYVSVSDPAAPRIYAYDLDARGKAAKRRVFFDAASLMGRKAAGLPDGMKVSSKGILFASAPGGMLILSPKGKVLGQITSPEPIANCAFGPDGKSLFLAANHKIFRLELR
jgi:gluconolactonase